MISEPKDSTGTDPLNDLHTCPICSSPGGGNFRTRFVEAAKCSNLQCGHIFSVGTPPGYGVQQIPHRDELFHQYRERNIDLIHFLRKRNFIRDGARLLDIGAGSGHILRSLKELHPASNVTCVEADPGSTRSLRGEGYTVYSDFSELRGTFDSVFLIEVIEHIDEPIGFLKLVRKFVARNGRIFLTTPCGELRNGSRATNAYDTREHVQFFTEKSLDLCLRKAGFAGFQFETINALTSKLTAPPLRQVKDILRPIRAKLNGHFHLTGFGWSD
jgi:SAM-dependent methyltransferase